MRREYFRISEQRAFAGESAVLQLCPSNGGYIQSSVVNVVKKILNAGKQAIGET